MRKRWRRTQDPARGVRAHGVSSRHAGRLVLRRVSDGTGRRRGATAALNGLAGGPIRVRVGIHTGTARVGEEGYVGVDVHRAARIAASGHGGQVLISASTAELVGTAGYATSAITGSKDLSDPERIYQLGAEDFPPLESLYRTNLPMPSTPFLGRRARAGCGARPAFARGRAPAHAHRAGGTGKTRLALQIAGELASRYAHGVWWVPLATLRDPSWCRERCAVAGRRGWSRRAHRRQVDC